MSPARLIERARRRLSDETGVVLVVAVAALLILGIVAASVLVTAVASNRGSNADRWGKQALAASLNGLRTAMYRLNTSVPADTACPLSAAGATVTPDADGACGPYSSTDAGAAQPSPSANFTYWVTPVLGTTGVPDRCTGSSAAPIGLPGGVVKERCITAMGQALGPTGVVTASRRVQARTSATGQLFIIPGIWGTDTVKVGSGQSDANIVGAIGSNGLGVNQTPSKWDIDLNAKNWGDSINPRTVNGHDYFMGGDVYFGRAAGTTPTASLVFTATSLTDPTAFPPATTVCSTCPAGVSPANTTNMLPISSLIVPDSSAGHPRDLGRRLPLAAVGPLFASPPPPVLPAAAGSTTAIPIYGGSAHPRTSSACLDAPPANALASPCDTSRRNDDAAGISQTGCKTPVYTAGSTGDTRSLTLTQQTNNGPPCVVTLQNGVYNFCNIGLGSSSSIQAADPSGTAEVYIFIDSNTRNVLPATAPGTSTAACKSNVSGVGNITNDKGNELKGAGSGTSFMNNAGTSLAGQLYFWGSGDSATSGNGTTAAVSHNVNIPNGWQFKGLVYAPNSNVDLNPNTVLQGGLAGRTVTVENGATYIWDVGVDLVDTNASRRTFYRVLFKHCSSLIPVVLGVQRPMEGC